MIEFENEKDVLVREYIKRTNPYKPLEPLKFDLRGYAAYLKQEEMQKLEIVV